jgi:uncharacterized membrane protein YgdD (TMEM256/DUF423 family)
MKLETSNKDQCPNWLPRAFASAGAAGVALGAFGAHALKEIRSAQQIETWKTATLYLLVHAAVGVCLSLATRLSRKDEASGVWVPTTALKLLFFGSVIFAGALYLLVLMQFGPLGAVAPIGGLMMISGWLILAARLRI